MKSDYDNDNGLDCVLDRADVCRSEKVDVRAMESEERARKELKG
jgi:hypothetical protein